MKPLKKTGSVAPIHSSQIEHSRIGLGFEKLDRNVFDPEKAYDKVAELGVKWIRIQSGWARTETVPGRFDFAWVDSIVDNLLKRGLQPWVCLCYGNGLYDAEAAKVFGAVGCPPVKTEEQKKAWTRYVSAFAGHFKGRIRYYEVWNEPDGIWCWKHGVSGKEYGELLALTAKTLKAADPDAKVIGGVLCGSGMQWLSDVFSSGNTAGLIDAFSYHAYSTDEKAGFDRVRYLRAFCKRLNPALEIIQGETGAQSRDDGAGALRGGAWTPRKQAAFLARHMLADLLDDVKFASYFSCMDMIEALNGTVGNKASYLDYGYFGVLAADFDENGFATGDYSPKPSYRTLQTIATVFRGDFKVEPLPYRFFSDDSWSPRILRRDDSPESILHGSFTRENGSCAIVYWHPSEILSETYESTVSIEFAFLPTEKIRFVDLVSGDVYELPENMAPEKDKSPAPCVRLTHIPVRDTPILLTFGNFF